MAGGQRRRASGARLGSPEALAHRLRAPPEPAPLELPANGFPAALLSLSDSQLEIVMAAAHPLRPDSRGRFLEAVARRLAGEAMIGDGAVSRACRELQRAYFDPPIETSPLAGLGKYG